MLQISEIKLSYEKAIEGLAKRGIVNPKEMIDQVIAYDEQRKSAQNQLDQTLAESNIKARQIGELMKSGQKKEAEEAKLATADLKNLVAQQKQALNEIQDQLHEALVKIPNIPNEIVPAGSSDEDNEVVYQSVNELPVLPDTAKPHWDLIKEYDIIDFELGNKITGAGFPVYKGKGAKLQRALVQYFLDQADEAGYLEIQLPLLVNEASGFGTGQLPDKEGQMYHATQDNLYLIPTAEVPITNIYRDTILNEDDLPIKNVGYTPCFRREAGAWGAHVRGLNRLHQFDKVEIVQIAHPDQSYQILEAMCDHVKMLLESLGLPYRILKLCGGDIGFTAALTYDFEIYAAAQKKWLEVSSVSNFETYQANRMKLRYKDKDNKKYLAHTLNGSALALPRILVGILENYQTADGIEIPVALRDYLKFDIIN